MSRISICLWFDTQAEDAAKHYVRTFQEMGRPASLRNVSRYSGEGPGAAGTVMTATFTLDGEDFMGLNGGPVFKHSPAMSIVVKCADQTEIDGFWDRLLEGGAPSQCGWLTDRFGVSWQVVPDALERLLTSGDGDQAARVTHAFMGMVKFDVAALERAAKGR